MGFSRGRDIKTNGTEITWLNTRSSFKQHPSRESQFWGLSFTICKLLPYKLTEDSVKIEEESLCGTKILVPLVEQTQELLNYDFRCYLYLRCPIFRTSLSYSKAQWQKVKGGKSAS